MSIEPDSETRDTLRDAAEDIRAIGGTEAEQIAAILYRISDLYDETEETSPRDIYVNMRTILRVTEQGGLDN